MVLRFLFRFLANNEQLVTRLSESYPIRRAAQLVVYMFNRGKAIADDTDVSKKLKVGNLSERLKQIRDDLQKKL